MTPGFDGSDQLSEHYDPVGHAKRKAARSIDPLLDENRTMADLAAALHSIAPSVLLHNGNLNKMIAARIREILSELDKREGLRVRSAPEPLVIGEVLVPVDTPNGPPEARGAWADALGKLIICVAVNEEGVFLAGRSLGRGSIRATEKSLKITRGPMGGSSHGRAAEA